jgi:hypothetical protein
MADFRLFISGHRPEPNINPSGAIIMGLGTESYPATISTADKKFLSFYVKNSATSGDNRGLYIRQFIAGAGGGGDAARIYSTVSDVAAATVHGAHISLDFGTSGTVTGQGIASRNTLHLPTTALTSNVTLAATQSEIFSDGTGSNPGASTLLSFQRFVNGGNSTGMGEVDDHGALLELQGFTNGAAHIFSLGTTAAFYPVGTLRIKIGATNYFIPIGSAAVTT